MDALPSSACCERASLDVMPCKVRKGMGAKWLLDWLSTKVASRSQASCFLRISCRNAWYEVFILNNTKRKKLSTSQWATRCQNMSESSSSNITLSRKTVKERHEYYGRWKIQFLKDDRNKIKKRWALDWDYSTFLWRRIRRKDEVYCVLFSIFIIGLHNARLPTRIRHVYERKSYNFCLFSVIFRYINTTSKRDQKKKVSARVCLLWLVLSLSMKIFAYIIRGHYKKWTHSYLLINGWKNYRLRK